MEAYDLNRKCYTEAYLPECKIKFTVAVRGLINDEEKTDLPVRCNLFGQMILRFPFKNNGLPGCRLGRLEFAAHQTGGRYFLSAHS